jgi:N-acetylated-alpha-linked acidic dipeptidase
MPNAALTTELTAALESVSLDLPWSLIERFTRLKREHPDDVRQACEEIVSRLKAQSVPVVVHEPEVFLSLPKTARIVAGDRQIRAKPMAMSTSNPKGITAPLAYVPSQYARTADEMFTRGVVADDGQDLRGKLVITEGFGMPGKVSFFEARGALGMIAVNPGKNPHWGICTTVWGTPDLRDLPRKPRIGVVAVSNPDGQELIERAKQGGDITLFTELEEGWYVSPIPVVTIPGTEEPEKFVLLHGHYDSWDFGIGDNAVGDATLLEIARVLWAHRDQLKRSVRIAWWPGHSTGRYAGSTWFSDHHAIDLYENCIAQVNCDSPGCRWATVYKDISWMPEAEPFAQDVIRAVTGQESHGERPHQAGDYSFNNIGITSYFMLLSTMPDDLREEKGYYAVGGCGGNIAWHTEEDLIDIADRDILLKDIKIYLAAVMGAANAPIAPFDFTHTIADFAATLDKYERATEGEFSFARARDEITALSASLKEFAAHTDSIRTLPITAPAVRRANEAIRRLARLLVPVNYTRGPEFFHDPAETIPALPDLAPALAMAKASPNEKGFYRTHLTRGQNRLVAALRDANALLRDTMA